MAADLEAGNVLHPPTSSRIVCEDPQQVAEAVARHLVDLLAKTQVLWGSASVVLTGGRSGIAVLERVLELSDRHTVKWRAVDFYWGDDRFVAEGHADRNELQARRALLDHLDVNPARIHPMEASDGRYGADAAASARAYSELLAQHHVEGEPLFDVCLLGVGEDGHVASLFPGLQAVRERTLTAVPVEESPKPPPTRTTLTLPALCASREVWLMATGATKAKAVAKALAGSDPVDVPAAGVRGVERTLWFLDSAAAGTSPP
jgi:6-phosphogluconolactonase